MRRFEGFWYQARTWDRPRYVVAKVEAHDKGSNRRFVVTNRPGAELLPGPTYDEYVERGESENRNKEIKCGLEMDRLSDHRFCANYFRLYLHALAMNLLVRLRRQVAEPWPEEPPAAEGLPAEAQTGAQRQRRFRQRRQRDLPLRGLQHFGGSKLRREASGNNGSASDGSGIRWGKGSRARGGCW